MHCKGVNNCPVLVVPLMLFTAQLTQKKHDAIYAN